MHVAEGYFRYPRKLGYPPASVINRWARLFSWAGVLPAAISCETSLSVRARIFPAARILAISELFLRMIIQPAAHQRFRGKRFVDHLCHLLVPEFFGVRRNRLPVWCFHETR